MSGTTCLQSTLLVALATQERASKGTPRKQLAQKQWLVQTASLMVLITSTTNVPLGKQIKNSKGKDWMKNEPHQPILRHAFGQSEWLSERRMQVVECRTGWGLDSDARSVGVLFLLVVVRRPDHRPDHPLILPTKRFPFKWAPPTYRTRPGQSLGHHLFGQDLQSSWKVKHDLLLQGKARTKTGAGTNI